MAPAIFVEVPDHQRPSPCWVTALLVLACVGCFLWLTLAPAEVRSRVVSTWGTVPSEWFRSGGLGHGWLWLRTVSALFIHADWWHLTGNLLFLLIFGLPAERALGARGFLILFLLGGAVANLFGAWTLAAQTRPIIGCSGAVSATLGAYLALFPRARLGLVLPLGLFLQFIRVPAALLIGMWALLQVLFTLAGFGFGVVAWGAHVGGFVFGVLYAWAARPTVSKRLRQAPP